MEGVCAQVCAVFFPGWRALCKNPVGLRPTLPQCFQERVTKPWPLLDLEGEEERAVGSGGGNGVGRVRMGEQRDERGTLGLCSIGFLALFREALKH